MEPPETLFRCQCTADTIAFVSFEVKRKEGRGSSHSPKGEESSPRTIFMEIDARERSKGLLPRPHVYYLEMIVGPMFSGKSEELIRRVRRAMIAEQQVQVFYPAQDTRASNGSIISRNGLKVVAEQVEQIAGCREQLFALPQLPDVVAFDEAQFFDEGLVPLVDALIGGGVRVIVAALDLDFAGRPFGIIIPQLLAMADRVDKLTAVCAMCGSEAAVRSQRLVDGRPATKDSPLVLVGDTAEGYEARCLRCYEPPR